VTELVANLQQPSGARKEHCGYCGDDGWVVVDKGNAPRSPEDYASLHKLREDNPGLRYDVYGEALAPCPYCEQGHANEFSGYFGPEGWWRGRPDLAAQLEREPERHELPPGENMRRLRELGERLGFAAIDD
jgi:hypothetical protein